MKSVFVLFALVIANVYSLSYNWPQNPTHVGIIKPHLTALFGLQSYSVTGPVEAAQPATFCDIPQGMSSINKVLLIERGNCTFYQKAQNALRIGALAVIIADVSLEAGHDFPLRMGYPSTENPSLITIPIVSTSGSDFITIQKLVFSSNGSLSLTIEQQGFDGHGSTGNNNPLFPPNPTGNHPTPNPYPFPNPTGVAGGDEDEDNDNHDRTRQGRSRSFIMNGMLISAIVISSCLCGFCLGRRCGNRSRYCRRQQQVHNPVPPVEGGEQYVQVDLASAPVAYYGEQEMTVTPVPSAPPQEPSSYPSSAPSNYA